MKKYKKWENVRICIWHAVPKFVFGKQKISLRVATDSDTVFREESIGEGFKIVT